MLECHFDLIVLSWVPRIRISLHWFEEAEGQNINVKVKRLGIAITCARFVSGGLWPAELNTGGIILLKFIFDINTESWRSKHAFQCQIPWRWQHTVHSPWGLYGTPNRMPITDWEWMYLWHHFRRGRSKPKFQGRQYYNILCVFVEIIYFAESHAKWCLMFYLHVCIKITCSYYSSPLHFSGVADTKKGCNKLLFN